MMGPTHVAIGTATALSICAIDPPTFWHGFTFVAATTFASKLPDQLEMGVLPHRGPTHWLIVSPLVAFAVGLSAYMISWTQALSPWIMAGVFVGYLMHLAADSCTVSGVPLFGPFSQRDRFLVPKGLRTVTESPRRAPERLISAVATLACVGLSAVLVLPLPQDGIVKLPELDKQYQHNP